MPENNVRDFLIHLMSDLKEESKKETIRGTGQANYKEEQAKYMQNLIHEHSEEYGLKPNEAFGILTEIFGRGYIGRRIVESGLDESIRKLDEYIMKH